jgi:histidine triad (HIT) family protein
MNCVFCKIARKEIPSRIVYEDNEILGFKNIEPEAPLHLLFVPKKHLEWKNRFGGKNSLIFSHLILSAKKTAIKYKIFPACKLIFNIGKTGHISHIHLHLIGGWKGKIPMGNVAKE